MPRPTHPVKTLLAARGLTAVDIAPQLGISVRTLRGAINEGTTWPKLRRQLAELLEVDEHELFPEHAARLTAAGA